MIHIDFTHISYQTPQILQKELNLKLEKIGKTHDIKLDQRRDFKGKFEDLIEKLSEKERVVILIDEYDKPIIDFVEKNKKDIATENRDILRNFYSIIKGSDSYLKFVFITGVSKFSKVSVFSVLNNLNDITLDEKYSTMLGYTEEELLHYFPVPGADSETMDKIRTWYNGYSWDGKRFVYNPFSILLYFEKKPLLTIGLPRVPQAFLLKPSGKKTFLLWNLKRLKPTPPHLKVLKSRIWK